MRHSRDCRLTRLVGNEEQIFGATGDHRCSSFRCDTPAVHSRVEQAGQFLAQEDGANHLITQLDDPRTFDADIVAPHLPPGGIVPVDGGIEGEVFHPLDFAPEPDRPVRRLFDDDVIAADLYRLAGEQLDDGGWTVNFNSASPAGSLEWRAYATIGAVTVLRTHERAPNASLES